MFIVNIPLPSNSIDEDIKSSKKENKGKDNSEPESNTGCDYSLENEIVCERNNKDAENNLHVYLKKWEVFALLSAASVGLLAIIVSSEDASRQRDAMQAQLDEMTAEGRPWLSTKIVPTSYLDITDDDVSSSFTYHIENVGKTPAINITVELAIDLWIPRDIKKWCDGVAAIAKEATDTIRADPSFLPAWGLVVVPGEKIDLIRGVDGKINSGIESRIFKTPYIYLSTCIDYQIYENGTHRQIGESYRITRHGVDIIASKSSIPPNELGFRDAAIWGGKYAN